jgi:hypothetical protein
LDGYEADSFDKTLADVYKENPVDRNTYTAPDLGAFNHLTQGVASQDPGVAAANADADARIAAANKQAAAIWDPFKKMFDGFVTRGKANAPQGSGDHQKQGAGDNLDPSKSMYKPEFTDLEKMGAISRSGTNNPALDYARRTAENTAKLVQCLSGTNSSGAAGSMNPGYQNNV